MLFWTGPTGCNLVKLEGPEIDFDSSWSPAAHLTILLISLSMFLCVFWFRIFQTNPKRFILYGVQLAVIFLLTVYHKSRGFQFTSLFAR